MKGRDSFPLWAWVAGPAVILVAVIGLLALLREGDPANPEAGIVFDDITEEPNQFLGETVTVYGYANVILESNSFLLTEWNGADDVLVISPVPLRGIANPSDDNFQSEDELSENDPLWVTGEVVSFDLAEAEQRVAADLDKETLEAYVGSTAIIADSISMDRPDALREEARGASGED